MPQAPQGGPPGDAGMQGDPAPHTVLCSKRPDCLPKCNLFKAGEGLCPSRGEPGRPLNSHPQKAGAVRQLPASRLSPGAFALAPRLFAPALMPTAKHCRVGERHTEP